MTTDIFSVGQRQKKQVFKSSTKEEQRTNNLTKPFAAQGGGVSVYPTTSQIICLRQPLLCRLIYFYKTYKFVPFFLAFDFLFLCFNAFFVVVLLLFQFINLGTNFNNHVTDSAYQFSRLCLSAEINLHFTGQILTSNWFSRERRMQIFICHSWLTLIFLTLYCPQVVNRSQSMWLKTARQNWLELKRSDMQGQIMV